MNAPFSPLPFKPERFSFPQTGLPKSVLGGLGALTALGTLAALVPYFASGALAGSLTTFFTLSLFGAAGVTGWLWHKVRPSGVQESLLREAFHSVLTPQLITDEAGNLILANRAFRGWINLGDQSLEQALSSRFAATPAVAAEYTQVQETLRKGQPGIAELPVMRGGKIVEWRRIVARPIDGMPDYIHWRFEDISERRRMEKAMRDEQSKLLDFMANAPVGIYSVDQYGRFRFVNRTLATWLQVEPDDLIKGDVHLHDILADAPPNIPPHAITLGAQGALHGETQMRRRDGALFPAAITQSVITGEDGKSLRTRSVVRDLSPEREWQQALSVSEYRFQRLFAEAPIGILLLDGKGVVMECNHAFEGIVKRPTGSVVGLSLAELIAERDKKATMVRLAEVLTGTDLRKPLDVTMADGRDVMCQIYAKRFELVGGASSSTSQKGLMLYFIDSTEQKKLELQFAQSQKMQAIGLLAGGIAHDFNNILTAMIGFCDLLLQRHRPGDQSFNDILQIKMNGDRAASLVKQLLAFSRQQTVQPKVLNIADSLSDMTHMMRRLLSDKVAFDVSHARDVGLVKIDKTQMEQIIVNLIVNARDAMQNSGHISIRTYNQRQDKPLMWGQEEIPAGDYVVIEVTDTGCGIPADNLQRIFEPFFSTKEVGAGTGLGLSTVYGIVRQGGGFINVRSTVGKGTTFIVHLPQYKDDGQTLADAPVTIVSTAVSAAAAAAEENKPAPDLTGAGTILLVEDEDAVRIFSTRALKNKGYNVHEARSGEEALTVLNKEGSKIDLVITDVVMPEMDGPTLYRHIRERWPTLKVVFVSGYTEDRLREQFQSGETIYFLPKPFSLKQLAGKVKDLLG